MSTQLELGFVQKTSVIQSSEETLVLAQTKPGNTKHKSYNMWLTFRQMIVTPFHKTAVNILNCSFDPTQEIVCE